MPHPIAERDIAFIVSNGPAIPGKISLFPPRPDQEWICDIRITWAVDGEKTFSIHGQDSLQSLNLALGFVASAVQVIESRTGGTARWNGGPVFTVGRL